MPLKIIEEGSGNLGVQTLEPPMSSVKEMPVMKEYTGIGDSVLDSVREMLAMPSEGERKQEDQKVQPLPPDTSDLKGKEKQLADLQATSTRLFEENRRLKALARSEEILDKANALIDKASPQPVAKVEEKKEQKPPETYFMTEEEFTAIEKEKGFLSAQTEFLNRFEAEKSKQKSDAEAIDKLELASRESVSNMRMKYPSYGNDAEDFSKFLLEKVVDDMQIYGTKIDDNSVQSGVKKYVANTDRLDKAYSEYLSSIGAPIESFMVANNQMARQKLASAPLAGSGDQYTKGFDDAMFRIEQKEKPKRNDPADMLDNQILHRRGGMF